MGTELYGKLLGLKERLQLKLDHHRFEEQCFDINKTLIEHGYCLRVFEAKNKSITVMKRDSEIQEMKKNVTSCIVKKFRGFDIVSIASDRRQRTKFSPIDIIYKPVKKWDDIIDCYFSIDLASTYRSEWSTGKSLRHARAYQFYYCSSYYIQKARYQKHIEKCSGIPGIVYNFTNQNLVSFEVNIGNKGDLPLVAYMDFETTPSVKHFLTPQQNKMFVVSYTFIFAFHPKLNLNRVIVQRSFGHSLLKLATVDYLTEDQL